MNPNSSPSALVVIPARLDSVRLARKMLVRVQGRTILEHTYRGAKAATIPQRVVVATPDQEIAEEVERFGGEVVWTSREAPSGTDRVAEASAKLSGFDLVVNVQGDEPQIPGSYVDEVLRGLTGDASCPVSTLAAPLENEQEIGSAACVKVVMNALGRAMYFSRNPIPHVRDAPLGYAAAPGRYWRHLGIYAYRREFLANLSQIQPSMLEQSERLEQLRWLEAGVGISIRKVPHGTRGIDTAEDLAAFEADLQYKG